MKRILMAGAVALLSLGATRSALASSAVQLVSGAGAGLNIVYYDGTTLSCSIGGVSTICATFGATASGSGGSLNVAATTFNGWSLRGDTMSAPPSCDTALNCLGQNQINTFNSGTAALAVYFASSGFTTRGPLYFGESSTALDGTGTATAKAYAYLPDGTLGLSPTAAPTLSGLFSTLSVTGTPGPGGQHKSADFLAGAAVPGASYNLASSFSFSPTLGGSGYNVTETISTSVPESSAVGVLLAMLLGIAFVVRKDHKARTADRAHLA